MPVAPLVFASPRLELCSVLPFWLSENVPVNVLAGALTDFSQRADTQGSRSGGPLRCLASKADAAPIVLLVRTHESALMYTFHDTPGPLPFVRRRRGSTATRCVCTGIMPSSVSNKMSAPMYKLHDTPGHLPFVQRGRRSTAIRCVCTGIMPSSVSNKMSAPMYKLRDTPGLLPFVQRRRRSTAPRCVCTGILLLVSVGQRRQNAAPYPLYGTSWGQRQCPASPQAPECFT